MGLLLLCSLALGFKLESCLLEATTNQKPKAPRAPQHRFRAPIYTRPSCCSVLRSGEQAVEPFEGPALGIFDLAHAKRTKLFIADGTQLLFALTAFIDRLCAALVDDAAVQSSSFLVVCFSFSSSFSFFFFFFFFSCSFSPVLFPNGRLLQEPPHALRLTIVEGRSAAHERTELPLLALRQ